MKGIVLATLFLAFLAISQSASAISFNGLGTALCNNLFNQPITGLGAVANTAYYTPLLQISFLIVIGVLTVLGLTYGIGTAFGIEVLKNFSRTEALESVFNLVLIILIFPGLFALQGISTFLGNIGQEAVLPISQQSGTTTPTYSMQQLCTNYMEQGLSTTLNGVIGLLPCLYYFSTMSTLELSFMPNDFGFSVKPFAGWYPWTQVLNIEVELYILVGGLMSGVSMFLFIIYFLFPIFLYAGILLRSFPWTRAAGGSMLSLFIAFYMIFPALLYPFSSQLSLGPGGNPLFSAVSCPATITLSILQAVTGYSSYLGTSAAIEMQGFVSGLAYSMMQVFGVAIAFIISYDLLERFGDLLGAPSLRSGKLLQKVI